MAAAPKPQGNAIMASSPALMIMSETNNRLDLTFEIRNIDVSFVNAIRRIILADIPCLVLAGPDADIDFKQNTSRMNNEIIKQRLACIPLHFDYEASSDDKAGFMRDVARIKQLQVVLDVTNNSDQMLLVTTKDMKVTDKAGTPVRNSDTILPANPLTGGHIVLVSLRPSVLLQQQTQGEQIHVVATISEATARQDSCFNVAHTCTYENIQDATAIAAARKAMVARIRATPNLPVDEQEAAIKDWEQLEAKRIYIPNAFQFTLHSVGPMPAKYILRTAIKLAQNTLKTMAEDVFVDMTKAVDANGEALVTEPTTTIANCREVRLPSRPDLLAPDYTIGKVLESVIHTLYDVPNANVMFCSFRKPHPHIETCFLRLALSEAIKPDDVNTMILNIMRGACLVANKVFDTLNID